MIPRANSAMAPVFSPSDAGTSEAVWKRFFSCLQPWQPETQRLIVVSPHPDDEILGAGGLIRDCALAGLPVTVVSVTDGEAADLSASNLNLIRRAELVRALRMLSPLHVRVERLGLPDGRVTQFANRLRLALAGMLDGSVTLVAPYERDGHPDHDAVGRVCVELAHLHRIPVIRFPIWTWHHSQPQHLSHLRWRVHRLNDETRRAKLRAVDCFDSQLRPAVGDAILPRQVLAHFGRPYEAFIV